MIYLTTMILIILKAMGYITLSWWWVTLVLWLPIAVSLGMCALGLVLALICVIGMLIIEFIDNKGW